MSANNDSVKHIMAVPEQHFNVSAELAKLKHEKKNDQMNRLPPSATIQRRPINHAPIASPFAGAQVQKVVYVSSKTPFMSAVKRVRKLLQQIEKRATRDVKLIDQGERVGMRKLAEAREKLSKNGESVLVKASGRAMAQALRVGEWFRSKEREMACKVDVKTANVSVVDDILDNDDAADEDQALAEQPGDLNALEGGDTTMELLEDMTTSTAEQASGVQQETQSTGPPETTADSSTRKTRKRKRKKRPEYDPDDLPEQRIRWIKTVEVAISFRA